MRVISSVLVLAALSIPAAALAQEEEGGLGGMDLGDEAFQESDEAAESEETDEETGEAAEGEAPEAETAEDTEGVTVETLRSGEESRSTPWLDCPSSAPRIQSRCPSPRPSSASKIG